MFSTQRDNNSSVDLVYISNAAYKSPAKELGGVTDAKPGFKLKKPIFERLPDAHKWIAEFRLSTGEWGLVEEGDP